MAAVEALQSTSAQLEPQTLTEISDDELNLPPSDDECEDPAMVKKELSVAGAEGEICEEKDDVLKFDQQVSGVIVLSLLDKIIGAVDQIQQTQNGLESRQQEMERSVFSIQGELTKLTKSHSTTSNSVNKMMEKVQKVSVNVKTVRATLEKQGGQIKKLENNEAELLKRRNFKVMIYQDDVKLPSRLSISKSMKTSESALGSRGGSLIELKEEVDGPAEDAGDEEKANKPQVDLSSDEEALEIEVNEVTRAEKLKRSSLQRVQNLKTVFSKEKMDKTKARTKENLEKTQQKTKEKIEKTKQKTKENIEHARLRTRENLEKTKQKTKENLERTRHTLEKKMGKLGTRMSVNQESKQKMQTSRDKVKKALTPNHAVYARSKSAVYKVPPFTFHVKKIRDGEVEVVQGTEMVEVSPEPEPFSGGEGDVEDVAEEVEMEMMNGGGDDEDAEEEEETHDYRQDDEDRDSD